MVSAWRIVKARYATGVSSGDGARKHGGRWNAPGARVVCAAGSAALAMLELLVHLESSASLRRRGIFQAAFDALPVTALAVASLPWKRRAEFPLAAVQRPAARGCQRQARRRFAFRASWCPWVEVLSQPRAHRLPHAQHGTAAARAPNPKSLDKGARDCGLPRDHGGDPLDPAVRLPQAASKQNLPCAMALPATVGRGP